MFVVCCRKSSITENERLFVSKNLEGNFIAIILVGWRTIPEFKSLAMNQQ